MKEIRAAARERMKGHCRVCPVCDGKACAGEVPGMGGLGTGASFRNNREALNACKLNMTALHDAREPRTGCTILGIDLSFPVMAAPIGGVSFNMSDAMSEDDYIFAILEGSRAAGVIGCTGDGVPPFIIDAAVKALKACNGHGIPFIKPWEGKELFEKIDRVLADGSPILGVDVDAAGLITLRKMGRPVMPMSVTELETVVRYVHDMGRKFIVKGIMTPDDAHRAIDAGCDAIVVSTAPAPPPCCPPSPMPCAAGSPSWPTAPCVTAWTCSRCWPWAPTPCWWAARSASRPSAAVWKA